jgi:vacuolar-type H+-ATPase subunit H
MMNEERLRQILKVEEQAQSLYETAAKKAESLPEQAEHAVQALLVETRQKAERDGERLTEEIINPKIIEDIVNQYAQRTTQRDALAEVNMSKAIDYVIQTLLATKQIA